MNIPTSFKINDSKQLLNVMQENAFATIVTTDEDGIPVATSLPFLIEERADQTVLKAHFAKVNPQWRHLESAKSILVIFNGPHCYISPSWYKNAGVPTWDYVTVHAYGVATLYNAQQTAELIEELSDKYEQDQVEPWQAQGNYSDKLLEYIVGFEINVQELQGKVKIGQNKSAEDLKGVVKALESSSSEQDKRIASLIIKHLESKD